MVYSFCLMKSIPNHIKSERLRCPVCASAYESRDVHILFQEKMRRIVHATCPKCESSLFLSLETNPFGMVGVGVPTDLSYAEAVARADTKPITSDTVIAVYRELQGK